jgi:hypothetical protein
MPNVARSALLMQRIATNAQKASTAAQKTEPSSILGAWTHNPTILKRPGHELLGNYSWLKACSAC